MSQGNLKSLVPVLDGSNWLIWQTQMSSYLQSKGLWQIVIGNESCPPDLVPTTRRVMQGGQTVEETVNPSDIAIYERKQKQIEWSNRDDMAIGFIMLRLSLSLQTHKAATSRGTWTALQTAFATQGPAAIYNDCQKLVNHRIAANSHSSADMDLIWDLLERLKGNGVEILKLLRAILLLSALPSSFDRCHCQTSNSGKGFPGFPGDPATRYHQI
jgi:gag-polypeptide of LTR copia-type/Domain of unknown function (DUF4219)